MSAFWSALAALFLEAFGKAAVDWATAWQASRQATEATANAAVSTAAAETQTVISETADARSQLSPASDAHDLAARLRARAAAQGGGGGS